MAINHINGFSTNPTSDQSAGVTTTPLNDIPSIEPNFYLAFDATNINGHYEIVLVTGKTATNVNHAATSFAHTTDEEVRAVPVASELDKIYQAPRGFLLNGKIVPSVTSNNLTVAIKTLAGADPSASDPVHIRIGDTVRTITSALSVTKNAGTSWCNAGSSELATKEIDYFVYLGYNATDGVVIGFSRIPFANEYDDFSTTSTNEKYCAISTITNAAAGDDYENIGRFAATLSAGAGYTWSVPTFTNKNLIQKPIYETRLLDYVVEVNTWTNAPTSQTKTGKYIINGRGLQSYMSIAGTQNASNSGTLVVLSLPVVPLSIGASGGKSVTLGSGYWSDNATFDESANGRINTGDNTKYVYVQFLTSTRRPVLLQCSVIFEI